MKYEPTIITQPLKWGEYSEVDAIAQGDSYFISVTQKLDTTFKSKDLPELSLRNKPYITLQLESKDLVGVVTEGNSFDLVVNCSEPVSVDTKVTFQLSHTLTGIDEDWRVSKDYNNSDDSFDYIDSYFTLAADGDYDTVSGEVIILAGSDTSSLTITTVDDGLLLKGKGSYRSSLVELLTTDNPDTLIHNNQNKGFILLEDASVYPLYEGNVEVWIKRHELLDFEPLIDPDTSSTVTLSLGYELVDDGTGTMIPSDSKMVTKIVDDVRLTSFQFRPLDIPEDLQKTVDLTLNLPYYRAVIDVGSRD